MGHSLGPLAPPTADVTAQIVLLPAIAASTAASSAASPAPKLLTSPLAISPVPPALRPPELNLPAPLTGSIAQPRQPQPDWTRALQRAASEVREAQELAQQRRRASGELPWPETPRSASSQPLLPWSHQPLTRWFDFNPATLVSSLNLGKHCQLVFFLILPAFGCSLGHIDSGNGGHFDASFDVSSLEPSPLELPSPTLPAPAEPWKAAGTR